MKDSESFIISEYLDSKTAYLIDRFYNASDKSRKISLNDIISILKKANDKVIESTITFINLTSKKQYLDVDELLLNAFKETLINQHSKVKPVNLLLAILNEVGDKDLYYRTKITLNDISAESEQGITKIIESNNKLKKITISNKPIYYITRLKESRNVAMHIMVEPSKPVIIIMPFKFFEESILFDLSKFLKFAFFNVDLSDLNYSSSVLTDSNKHDSIAVQFGLNGLSVNTAKDFYSKACMPLVILASFDDFSKFSDKDLSEFNIIELSAMTANELKELFISNANSKGVILQNADARLLAKLYKEHFQFSEYYSPQLIFEYFLAYLATSRNKSIIINKNTILSFFKEWLTNSSTRKTFSHKDILRIQKALESKILGQHSAIEKLINSLKVTNLNINNSGPIGTFLFVGPTGVGKTETAKLFAEYLFNNDTFPKPFLRIDMNEYSEKHTVARLLGAPPGYVGFEEGGILSSFLINNPECLILFDEIDKAHPEVLNSLIKMLEESTVTFGTNQPVYVDKAIFIMTSNHGTTELYKQKPGFLVNSEGSKEYEFKLIEAVKKSLRPELVNRFTNIVVFNPLSFKEYSVLTNNQLNLLKNKLADQDVKLTYSTKVVEKIIRKSNTKEYGVRDIYRVINNEIISEIAMMVGKIKAIKISDSANINDKFIISYN